MNVDINRNKTGSCCSQEGLLVEMSKGVYRRVFKNQTGKRNKLFKQARLSYCKYPLMILLAFFTL